VFVLWSGTIVDDECVDVTLLLQGLHVGEGADGVRVDGLGDHMKNEEK